MSSIKKLETEIEEKKKIIESFAIKWLPIYRKVLSWINARLKLIEAKSIVYETMYCFVIFGWLPSKDLARVREELEKNLLAKSI